MPPKSTPQSYTPKSLGQEIKKLLRRDEFLTPTYLEIKDGFLRESAELERENNFAEAVDRIELAITCLDGIRKAKDKAATPDVKTETEKEISRLNRKQQALRALSNSKKPESKSVTTVAAQPPSPPSASSSSWATRAEVSPAVGDNSNGDDASDESFDVVLQDSPATSGAGSQVAYVTTTDSQSKSAESSKSHIPTLEELQEEINQKLNGIFSPCEWILRKISYREEFVKAKDANPDNALKYADLVLACLDAIIKCGHSMPVQKQNAINEKTIFQDHKKRLLADKQMTAPASTAQSASDNRDSSSIPSTAQTGIATAPAETKKVDPEQKITSDESDRLSIPSRNQRLVSSHSSTNNNSATGGPGIVSTSIPQNYQFTTQYQIPAPKAQPQTVISGSASMRAFFQASAAIQTTVPSTTVGENKIENPKEPAPPFADTGAASQPFLAKLTPKDVYEMEISELIKLNPDELSEFSYLAIVALDTKIRGQMNIARPKYCLQLAFLQKILQKSKYLTQAEKIQAEIDGLSSGADYLTEDQICRTLSISELGNCQPWQFSQNGYIARSYLMGAVLNSRDDQEKLIFVKRRILLAQKTDEPQARINIIIRDNQHLLNVGLGAGASSSIQAFESKSGEPQEAEPREEKPKSASSQVAYITTPEDSKSVIAQDTSSAPKPVINPLSLNELIYTELPILATTEASRFPENGELVIAILNLQLSAIDSCKTPSAIQEKIDILERAITITSKLISPENNPSKEEIEEFEAKKATCDKKLKEAKDVLAALKKPSPISSPKVDEKPKAAATPVDTTSHVADSKQTSGIAVDSKREEPKETEPSERKPDPSNRITTAQNSLSREDLRNKPLVILACCNDEQFYAHGEGIIADELEPLHEAIKLETANLSKIQDKIKYLQRMLLIAMALQSKSSHYVESCDSYRKLLKNAEAREDQLDAAQQAASISPQVVSPLALQATVSKEEKPKTAATPVDTSSVADIKQTSVAKNRIPTGQTPKEFFLTKKQLCVDSIESIRAIHKEEPRKISTRNIKWAVAELGRNARTFATNNQLTDSIACYQKMLDLAGLNRLNRIIASVKPEIEILKSQLAAAESKPAASASQAQNTSTLSTPKSAEQPKAISVSAGAGKVAENKSVVPAKKSSGKRETKTETKRAKATPKAFKKASASSQISDAKHVANGVAGGSPVFKARQGAGAAATSRRQKQVAATTSHHLRAHKP